MILRYVRAYRKLLKWILKVLGIMFLLLFGTMALGGIAGEKASSTFWSRDEVELHPATKLGEAERVVYSEKETPKDFGQEVEADPDKLIYQNQSRFYKTNPEYQIESSRADVAPTPALEKKAMAKTVRGFLQQWESFEVGESDSSYRRRLAPYVVTGQLERLGAREDNIQNSAVGRDGETGSYLSDLRPSDLVVLRFSPTSAYVSHAATITYIGPSYTWMGGEALRSYGLVLVKQDGQWKVTRAAAQTLSRLD